MPPPNTSALAAIRLLPADAAGHGPALDAHLLLNLWIALGLFALAHALLAVGLLIRATGPASAVPRRTWRIEYLPLAALTLLFAFLTLRAERLWAAARYTGADPAAMQVEVTGMQFAWYFRYPGPDATFGRTRPALVAPGEGNPIGLDPTDPASADDRVTSELVLPAGREVDLRLRAQDVIHGFSVPNMRLKQNAVPGETIHLHFTPTVAGTYPILCTQVCGLGHYRMSASLRIVSPADFTAWLADRTPHPTLMGITKPTVAAFAALPLRPSRLSLAVASPAPRTQTLPQVGDPTPASLLKSARTCDTGEGRHEPCAALTITHKDGVDRDSRRITDRITVAWDAATKHVTYLYSTTLATDEDMEAGDVGEIDPDIPVTPFPIANVPHRFVTPEWADTDTPLSGPTLWYAVMRPDHPHYGRIVGFVQSLYLNLPDIDAPTLHHVHLAVPRPTR